MTESFNQEVWVSCPPCGWTWRIAFLPMDMRKLGPLMSGTRCPKCGEKKGLVMAAEADIRAALETQIGGA